MPEPIGRLTHVQGQQVRETLDLSKNNEVIVLCGQAGGRTRQESLQCCVNSVQGGPSSC
jgi:hypothetical protein